MKKAFSISIASFLIFTFCQSILTSCTKTNTVVKTVIDTFTVVQKDTLVIKDTAMTVAILTANSWKPQQITALVGNTNVDYIRGGVGNTIPLDNEYITFNSNGSGIYTDNSGITSTFSWNFTNATNTALVWNWNLTLPATKVTWQNVVYKNASISYTETYTVSGINTLGAGIRIPR
jgi:hypothetical protein